MIYFFDSYALDIDRRELRRETGLVALQPQVFDLLEYLVRHRDRVVTKDDMLDAIWGGRIVSESTLTSRINAARTAIGDRGDDQRLIRTLPRKGIRFIGTVREESHSDAETGVAAPVIEAPALRPPAPLTDRPPTFERRQLTVVSCELLLGAAAARMEPEDLSDVIGAYHRWIKDTVSRFNGSIGHLAGVTTLAYFGYPAAHEDDAEQAVRAGLALCGAAGQIEPHGNLRLHARVGIATGRVIIGETSNGDAGVQAPVGEAPGTAAQLQNAARPDTVVIDSATRRLIGTLFECHEAEPINVSGTDELLRAWNVLGAGSIESRFEALRPGALTPLVGRGEEVELLLRRWTQAKSGEGRVVLISGEPGIGKSRLVAALQETLQAEPHTQLRYFCSPQHTDSAFYPIIRQIERSAEMVRDDTAQGRLDKLDTLLARTAASKQVAGLLAEMLSLPNDGRYPALDLMPEQRRRRTLEALMTQMNDLARQSPVLMIVEDVHWADPTSLEVFNQAVNRITGFRALLIMTFRPEFEAPWIGQPPVTALTINRLTQREIGVIIDGLVGNQLIPTNIRQGIIERTDGIPLFVEEITKAVLETESANEARSTAVANASPAFGIPPTLQASLMARLDRLGSAKEIAQIGAALGREFSHAVLAAVVRKPEAELLAALGRLVSAGLLFRQGVPPHASYLFKHALVQDAAYGTMIREPRRALHARIAETLECQFAEITEARPELLASHCTEAGLIEKAAALWGKAGLRSLGRSALVEAVEQLTRALDQIATLPTTPALRREQIKLQVAVATALMQGQGYRSEHLGQILEAARLAASKSDSVELQCEVLLASCSYFYATGCNSDYARLAAEQLEAHSDQLSKAYVGTLWATKGIAHFNRGELRLAVEALHKARDLIDRTDSIQVVVVGGADHRVVTHLYLARSLLIMGMIDEAGAISEGFIEPIDRFDKPFEMTWALLMKCDLCVVFGRDQLLLAYAEKLIEISKRHGYQARLGNGLLFRGLARSRLGEPDAAANDAREGMRLWRSQGVVFHTPERICLTSEILVGTGRLDETSQLLDDVDTIIRGTDEACFSAECIRIRGQIASERSNLTEAVRLFEEAIALSQRQEARLFELRAMTNLAPLLAKQGRGQEAAARLRAVIEAIGTKAAIFDGLAARKTLDALRG